MENHTITRAFLMSIVVLFLQFHYSLCYISPCSVTTMTCPNDMISSGNGEEEMAAAATEQLNQTDDQYNTGPKYVLETSIGLGADTSVIEITLKFASCIPYNHEAPTGPKWFKVEAISNRTGQTVGEFNTPPFHTETELCPNNVIAFRTTNPTVLDMPRTYRWKQTSQVEESVCFRATIIHYPDNTCETITKCLPSTDVPTATPVDNGNKITNEIVFEPDNNTVKQCNRQWDCENPEASWKPNKPHCTCNPMTKKCKLFSMKCQARREKCFYKGLVPIKIHRVQTDCSAFEETITEPPTTSTLPPPTLPPIKGYCKKFGSKMTCSSTGDFKLSQCLKYSDTEYSCFCATYGVGAQIVISERKIRMGTCDSTSTYDLNCIRD